MGFRNLFSSHILQFNMQHKHLIILIVISEYILWMIWGIFKDDFYTILPVN